MTKSRARDAALRKALSSPDETVRLRAELVIDAASIGAKAAASRHGVTRRTASEWLRRYREGGVASLTANADREKRQDELHRDILTAPLWMPTTKWSSRSIAESLGVSQSAVARAWRSAVVPDGAAADLSAWAGSRSVTVSAALVSPNGSVLVLSRSQSPRPRGEAAISRAQRRYRAILAADLARDRIVDEGHGLELTGRFWEALAEQSFDSEDLLVLTSAPAFVSPSTKSSKRVEVLEFSTADQWHALGSHLAALTAPTALTASAAPAASADEAEDSNLAELETRLRRWYQHGGGVFTWHAPEAADHPLTATAQSPEAIQAAPLPRALPEQVFEDSVIAAIRRGIAEGRFTGGDVVTERFLAERLNTTRGRIREALRLLAIDGLTTADTLNGATIPIPTVADIAELYTARRALGSIAVNAATQWTPEGREAVLTALRELELCTQTGDMEAAHHLDQRFQNAVARSSTLWRVPAMLESLSRQLLMYISVIGVRYAFPVADIVTRDREIFEAIDAGDQERALGSWKAKIDESATYMVKQFKLCLTEQRSSSHPADWSRTRQ